MRKTMGWNGLIIAGVVLVGLSVASLPMRADSTAAEATYKAKCAMCHGADGKGETPTGKAMKVKDFASEEVQKMSDADLSAVISGGKRENAGVQDVDAGAGERLGGVPSIDGEKVICRVGAPASTTLPCDSKPC